MFTLTSFETGKNEANGQRKEVEQYYEIRKKKHQYG